MVANFCQYYFRFQPPFANIHACDAEGFHNFILNPANKEEKTLEEFLINRFAQELYLLFFKDYTSSIAQKETETSLIEQFTYPKLGPGRMWEEVARCISVP